METGIQGYAIRQKLRLPKKNMPKYFYKNFHIIIYKKVMLEKYLEELEGAGVSWVLEEEEEEEDEV